MNKNVIERIAAYLQQSMTPGERVRFEAELAVDSELSATLELYQSIEHTMQVREEDIEKEEVLKQTLTDLGRLYFNPPQVPGKPVRDDGMSGAVAWITEHPDSLLMKKESRGVRHFLPIAKLAAAAIVIGFIVFAVYWYYWQPDENSVITVAGREGENSGNRKRNVDSKVSRPVTDSAAILPNPPSGRPVDVVTKPEPTAVSGKSERLLAAEKTDSLFARYFIPDGAPEKESLYLKKAFRFYKAGQFSRAINAFEEITDAPLTRGAADDERGTVFQARYYQAISCLAAGKTTQALLLFQQLADNPSDSQLHVWWYFALAHLKAGNTKEALNLLNKLAQKASDHRRNAQQLLTALSTNK